MSESYIEKIEKIGLFSLIILGIGSLTGVGIFSLLSLTASVAGPATIISLLLGAVFAFLIVGFYSEVISVKPINGGGFMYVKEAYGEKALYLGWLTWLANMAFGSLVAHTTASFVTALFQINEIFIRPIAIGFVLIMAIINLRGSKFLSQIQIPLTFALVGSLMIGSMYLFLNPEPSAPSNFENFFPYGFWSIIPAAALLFVEFIGFEHICTISEEAKNPKKIIPRGLFIMLSLAIVIYLIVIISLYFSTSLSVIQQSEIAFLDAVSKNTIVYYIVYIGAIFSLLTTLGLSLMAQSRNLVGLSINDFIDRKYSEIEPEANAPIKAIKLSSLITILIIISGQVEFYASITVMSYMFIVNSLGFTIFKYRKTKKYEKDTFKLPLHPITTVLGMILSGLLIITLDITIIFVPILWLLIGLILYLFFSSKRRIYGTIFLVTAFFFAISSLILGIIILIIGFIYYLLIISDRISKILILAGIKFLYALMGFIFILMIKFSGAVLSNYWVLDLLVLICFFAIITSVFDLIPLHELINFIYKKRHEEEVVIKIDKGYIIELSKPYKRMIYLFNDILGYIQITSMGFILFLFSQTIIQNFLIETIVFFNITFLPALSNFFFSMLLLFLGSFLGLSGCVLLYYNRESKKMSL